MTTDTHTHPQAAQGGDALIAMAEAWELCAADLQEYAREEAADAWREAARDVRRHVAAVALAAPSREPVPADVTEALFYVDDFIARCNGDDRGSCESVNVLRRFLADRGASPADTERLDWITHQAEDFSCTVIVDRAGDGLYEVAGMAGAYGTGTTPRAAIDAARASKARGDASMDQLRQRLLGELDTRPDGYPTWWVRHHLPDVTTEAARAEFKRMESDGLVVRHRNSSSNCILWVKAASGTGATTNGRSTAAPQPSAQAPAVPDDFLQSVRRLCVVARTTGGTAGRDEGLCAALDQVEALLQAQAVDPNAARYVKLRRWMSSGVKEGWEQVEQLASIACYVDWDAFDESLDALPECNYGLCSTASAEPQPSAQAPAVPDGWAPIETAPRDGSKVILWWGGYSRYGSYLDNRHTSAPWAGWKVPSLEVLPTGTPTHWMPMPKGPTP